MEMKKPKKALNNTSLKLIPINQIFSLEWNTFLVVVIAHNNDDIICIANERTLVEYQ